MAMVHHAYPLTTVNAALASNALSMPLASLPVQERTNANVLTNIQPTEPNFPLAQAMALCVSRLTSALRA